MFKQLNMHCELSQHFMLWVTMIVSYFMNLTAQTKCGLLKLIQELEVLLQDAPCSEEEEMYRETIVDLQELIQSKQLLATEELLKVQETLCSHSCLKLSKRVLDCQCFLTSQNASEGIDSETGNMQTVVKDRNATVCLWANFRKNPRWVGENGTINRQRPSGSH